MLIMYAYDTITEAVADLKKRGYSHDFNISDNRLNCDKLDKHFSHDDFEIKEVYRFEGPPTRQMKQLYLPLRRHLVHWVFWWTGMARMLMRTIPNFYTKVT